MRRVISASNVSVTGGRRVAQSGIGRVACAFPLRAMVVSPLSKGVTTVGVSSYRTITLSRQCIEQCPSLLEVGGIKTLSEPAVDLGQELTASARLPCCCHKRARLMAVRNS